ncbi:MAG TPA: alpha/beta hydrolase [Thermoleophilaceae bacterium]|nr:alpha/beta hydrolase [Thermoleophilaceae bacterium]
MELCAEAFGDPGDPPLLLIGNSMLEWDAELCRRLASGGRHVIRYDLRDTGRSTTVDPGAPAYTLRDLVADAAGLTGALGLEDVHVAGRGPGGWIAQLLALDHPGTVRTLTLVGTRPTSPGKADADLPDHNPELMKALFGGPEPDWSDRESVVETMVAGGRAFAGTGGFDEQAARQHAEAVFDRTEAALPEGVDIGASQRANQQGAQFAAMKSGGRWRGRLGKITAPTLVVHGEDDPFFPIGNGQALAAEIPGATLLALPGVGQELPRRAWDEFAGALLAHTA